MSFIIKKYCLKCEKVVLETKEWSGDVVDNKCPKCGKWLWSFSREDVIIGKKIDSNIISFGIGDCDENDIHDQSYDGMCKIFEAFKKSFLK